MGSGIQLKKCGIPPTIGIQNPSSTDKYWNPVPRIRNPQRVIQNPRLSWIPGTIDSESFLCTPNSNKRKKGCDCGDQRNLFLDRRLCVEIILKITDNFIFSLSLSLSHALALLPVFISTIDGVCSQLGCGMFTAGTSPRLFHSP